MFWFSTYGFLGNVVKIRNMFVYEFQIYKFAMFVYYVLIQNFPIKHYWFRV